MILASLCMRGGSKGVKNKNLKKLNNKPLYVYTYKVAKKSLLIDDIVVSTDSHKIRQKVSNHFEDIKIFDRSKNLSSDNSSKWDVFKDLVIKYENRFKTKIDYLLDLDVTVPTRTTDQIDMCIKSMIGSEFEVLITGYKPERNPYFNMMEKDSEGNYRVVKKLNKNIVNRQNAPDVYSLSPSVFLIKRDTLFKHKHWSEAKCNILEIPRLNAIDIDTDFDFIFVEYLLKKINL